MSATCGAFPVTDIDERGLRYLRMFDMDRFQDRLAGRLSGGMKQKLALACALVPEPRVLAAGRADYRRRSRFAARVLGHARASRRRWADDRCGHAVSRRSRALPSRRADASRARFTNRHAGELRAAWA